MIITEVLEELGISYKHSGESKNVRSGWVGIDCPYCFVGKSGGEKLGLSLEGWGCVCWSCGILSLSKVLADVSGRHWVEVKKLVGGIERDRTKEVKKTGKLVLPKGLGPLLPIHRRYLKGRGFDPDEMERLWGLQGIGRASRLGWRLFIPVIWRGETVSWTTRAVTDEGTRYKSASPEEEAVHHKHLLLGDDLARHAVVVVEGPADAFNVGPGAVATFGVSFTPAQVLKLSKVPTRVICFDSEAPAQRRAKELVKLLAPFPGKTFRVELDAKDPGSATKKEIRLLRKAFLE